jgi:hypothetical protein
MTMSLATQEKAKKVLPRATETYRRRKSVYKNTFSIFGTVSNPEAPGGTPATNPVQRPADPENPEVQPEAPVEESVPAQPPEPIVNRPLVESRRQLLLTVRCNKGIPFVPTGIPPKGPVPSNPMEKLCPVLVPKSNPSDGPPSPGRETPRSRARIFLAHPNPMQPGSRSIADADPDPEPSREVVSEPPTPPDARPAPDRVKNPAPLNG